MEGKNAVPYIVHEGEMARAERHIKRLWILCIIIFLALIATNAGWIYYESQYEDLVLTQEVEQDAGEGGTNNFRGNVVGGNYNGETED